MSKSEAVINATDRIIRTIEGHIRYQTDEGGSAALRVVLLHVKDLRRFWDSDAVDQ